MTTLGEKDTVDEMDNTNQIADMDSGAAEDELDADESMNIYELLQTDEKREQQGVKVPLGGKQYLLVARAGGSNRAFTTMLASRLMPYQRLLAKQQRLLKAGKLPSAKVSKLVDRVTQEVYAQTIVLGWLIFDKEQGEIPFTTENCIRMFKEVPELFYTAQEYAQDLGTFQDAENLELALKN